MASGRDSCASGFDPNLSAVSRGSCYDCEETPDTLRSLRDRLLLPISEQALR
jgi:hypothetical protein